MSQSFPSKPVIGIDVPEVKHFSGKFVYNFHVPDERINDNGSQRKPIIKIGPGKKTSNKFIAKAPRFVSLTLSPVKLKYRFDPYTATDDPNRNKRKTSISRKFNKIHSEREFSNAAFTGIGFQDTGIDRKLFLITSGTLAKRVNSKNEITQRKIGNAVQDFVDSVESNKISLQDAAKFLSSDTGDDISNDFLVDSLNELSNLGAIFINEEKQEEIINDRFEDIKKVDLKMKFNNKIVAKALKTSLTDPMSIFVDELEPLLPQAESAQIDAIHNAEPGTISSAEYELIVDYVKKRKVSFHSFQPTSRVIGYIIDKYEITTNNQVIEHTPIIIEDPATHVTTDLRVAYGITYAYAIRTVVEIDFLVTDEDTDDFYAATVLVSSSPSPRVVVQCKENVPPPPPADFNVSWDYTQRAPRLMWAFPTNTQRDIKYWQVFRRSSIRDPYQLIKQFDFDDSVIKTLGYETVNLSLIETLTSPKNFLVDKEFTKDSKAIYTVCAIDAHGLSSNYAMQFEVSFDRYANKIVKKLISTSGAPKPYPNMLLNQDTFVDVMKDSGHSKMTVYFDPEYLRVFERKATKTEDVKLIGVKENGGSYRMQFINTDLQKSAILDIVIDDLTEGLIDSPFRQLAPKRTIKRELATKQTLTRKLKKI